MTTRPAPSERYDVAVIGGGIIGCACARELSLRGLHVLLLEREGLAAGASGACDGHLTVQTKAAGLHTQLALQSLDLYRALPATFREAAEFRECGSLLVAQTPTECDALDALLAQRESDGVAVRSLTGSEARQHEPALGPGVRAAGYRAQDAQLDPRRATHWFAREAVAAGAHLRTSEVLAVEPGADGVLLRTAAGDVRASHALLACGAWTPLLSDALGGPLVRPRRGEVLVTEALPPLLRGLVVSASYLARKFGDSTDRVTAVVEQTLPGNLLIGATRDFVGYDRTVTRGGLQALAQAAAQLVPQLATANVVRSFAGLRPASLDGLPYLGPLAAHPRVILATGHEGDGITLAPVTAKLITDWLLDGAMLDRSLQATRPAGSPA